MEIKSGFPSRKDRKKRQKKSGLPSLFNLFSFGGSKKNDKEVYPLGNSEYTSRKNRRKFVGVIFQFIILGFVIYGFASLFLTMTTYKPYNAQTENLSRNNGFIALSYIGTQRLTTHNTFGLGLLRRHLTALKNLGYVTVTQQDIIDYYQSGKALPEKALFLLFEDGRRNTVLFSQKVLEELNFKATMLTYPEQFLLKDPVFLKPDEIAGLTKTTFWEIGSNGYRYAFINDYQAMRDIYTKQTGMIPELYALPHPNTGKFGDHDDASAVNEYWIKELYKINFNRAGSSVNKPGGSIYDLTRMQPQAWWSVNHLLIKLKHDLCQDLEFITGDPVKAANWHILKGTAEFQEKAIILTSFPRDTSLLKLKESDDFQDMHLAVRLKGNMLGRQKIYFRADGGLTRFLAVCIADNFLYVTEKTGGAERELFKLNLDRHDGNAPRSVPEDRKMAEISELETFLKYAPSKETARIYEERLKAKKLESVPTIADGAAEYTPIITADAAGDRTLLISLRGGSLSLTVDGKEAVKNLPLAATAAGQLYLEAGWSGKSGADEVYDGVFEDLVITDNTGIEKKKEKILFDIRPQGKEALKFGAKQVWAEIVGIFLSKF